MSFDQICFLAALVLFILAAVGTYIDRAALVACGWVGLAVCMLAAIS